MIPINQRKPTMKKNPKRINVTMFVWAKHTCTSDFIMRANRIAVASIDESASHVSNVQRKDDSAKDRKIFDTVRMGAHRAFVPICSINLDQRGSCVSQHVQSESGSSGILQP